MKYFWLFLGAVFLGLLTKIALILEHLLHFWLPPSVEEISFFKVYFILFYFIKFSNYLCRSNLAYKL